MSTRVRRRAGPGMRPVVHARVMRRAGPGACDGSRRRDRGSGTVLVVGAMGFLLALVLGALAVVGAVVASHRAQSAADLAALAAAGVLARGEAPGSACAVAGRIAGRGEAGLVSCRAEPDLSVEVVVTVRAGLSAVGTATARSRAGPAP